MAAAPESADRPIWGPRGAPYDATVSDLLPQGSAATAAAGGRSAPVAAPASLDRLLARAQHASPALTQASDVVLVVATALLALVDLTVWATDPVVDNGRSAVPLAFLVPALGALAAAAMALRPRHLAGTLLTLATACTLVTFASAFLGASLPPSFAALFALGLLTTGVLRREPGGSATLLTAFAAVAVAAEAMRPMVSAAGYLLVVCAIAFGVAIGVGVYLRWSDWRRAVAAEAARTEERLEIARELHDLVGHYVTGIVVQAQAARHVADRRPSAAPDALDRIESAGTEALLAMRRMVGGLRENASLEPGATWESVERLLADAVARGEPVAVSIGPDVGALPTALAPSVSRILVEGLTNVRRHAREVTHVDVVVRRRDEHLEVTVHDDGAPGVPDNADGFGIVGMRERAAALGGTLFAGPAPGGGWIVRAALPVESPR